MAKAGGLALCRIYYHLMGSIYRVFFFARRTEFGLAMIDFMIHILE